MGLSAALEKTMLGQGGQGEPGQAGLGGLSQGTGKGQEVALLARDTSSASDASWHIHTALLHGAHRDDGTASGVDAHSGHGVGHGIDAYTRGMDTPASSAYGSTALRRVSTDARPSFLRGRTPQRGMSLIPHRYMYY